MGGEMCTYYKYTWFDHMTKRSQRQPETHILKAQVPERDLFSDDTYINMTKTI